MRTRGPELRLAETQVAGARADVVSAGARPNPSVGAGLAKSFAYPAECAGCTSVGFNLSVSDSAALSDELSGKHALRVRVAGDALEAARSGRTDALRQVSLALEQQFTQAALARESVALATEAHESAAQTLRLTQVRFAAGAISEADVMKAQTAELEAQQVLEQTSQALASALASLSAFFGQGNGPTVFTVDTALLHGKVPPKLADTTKESLLALAADHRPDLQVALAQKTRAGSALMLAERLRVPDVALQLQHQQEGVGPNALTPPTLTLGVSVALPLLYRFEGEVAHAKTDIDAAGAQEAKLRAQIDADVGAAFAAFSSSRRQTARMEESLLEHARRTRDLVLVQYQKGAASLLEYLDAERTYITVRGEYLQDLANLWTAVFLLEASVGMELRS